MTASLPRAAGARPGRGRHSQPRPERSNRGRAAVAATLAAAVLAVVGAATVAVGVVVEARPQGPSLSVSAVGPRVASARPASRPLVLPPSDPVAIDIPAIGVHSGLQHLGLTEEGGLEVPAPGPKYDEAAWYKYSPTPGALGPSVISGHVDSASGGPSVFFRLGDLRPGDQVVVSRADGLAAKFQVDGLRVYPKDEFPTELVYGNTNQAALRLITCGGLFDRATGHYVDNVIVFASMVGSGQAVAPSGARGTNRTAIGP